MNNVTNNLYFYMKLSTKFIFSKNLSPQKNTSYVVIRAWFNFCNFHTEQFDKERFQGKALVRFLILYEMLNL